MLDTGAASERDQPDGGVARRMKTSFHSSLGRKGGWPCRPDLRFALRRLRKSPGFTFVAVITLALGIGANAAIFTLVRGVLIKPLVNRDEDRLIYIRQSAPGIGNENSTLSMPEIRDLKARIKTLSEFGDFSTIDFTMIGLGKPREFHAGVVNGSYFEVMGLHPVLGRLIGPDDDGPKAAGVVVLTYRFWSNALNRILPSLAKRFALAAWRSLRHDHRRARALRPVSRRRPKSSPTL